MGKRWSIWLFFAFLVVMFFISMGVNLEQKPPVVALTFDDGPRSDVTESLLDELALREVQATFFVVGYRIPSREAIIRRMAAEGHQIGVHSYSHVPLTGFSQEQFDLEVAQTRFMLSAILGDRNFWLRPPYGYVDDTVRQWAKSPIILWSVDPEDWRDDHNITRMVETVLNQVRDGDIILFHDVYQTSAQAAIRVVDALLERGYCFATVEQLLSSRGVPVENGMIYYGQKILK